MKQEIEEQSTLLAKADFLNDTLGAQLFAIYAWEEEAVLLQPKATYRVTSELTLGLSADVVWAPDENGFYSQFRDAERVLLSLDYRI